MAPMTDRIVRLRLSAPMLLQHMLHLDEGVLVGASVELLPGSGEGVALCLLIRHPDAPEGADEMLPLYIRRDMQQVELERIDWAADGKPLAASGE